MPHSNPPAPRAPSLAPLFIPLKTSFYNAFDNGTKTIEYRRYGPRWNERTCPVGRPVILSKGYGKAHRLTGIITAFRPDATPTLIPGFRECYPTGQVAACITILLDRNRCSFGACTPDRCPNPATWVSTFNGEPGKLIWCDEHLPASRTYFAVKKFSPFSLRPLRLCASTPAL
jgi:hypothetical protein